MKRFVARTRAPLLAALALAGAPVITAQPEPVAADEEIYVLPPFFVEKRAQAKIWYYLATDDLEILSTGSDLIAREFARNYFRQEQVLRQLIPARFLWHSPEPQMLLLVDDNDGTAVSDEALNAFFAGNDFLVGRHRGTVHTTPNLRLVDRDRTVVFATHQMKNREDHDFLAATFMPEISQIKIAADATRHQLNLVFTAERIGFLLNNRAPLLPAWFRSGFIDLYTEAQFGETSLGFDAADWRSPATADRLRLDPDYPREVMPLPAFLAQNPTALPPVRRQAWRDQAALMTRWALFADDGAHREALWSYLDRVALTGETARSFRNCFGFDYAEARDRISDFLPVATLHPVVFPLQDIVEAPNFPQRRATPLEIARIRAEWERLEVNYVREHHPDLVAAYFGQAQATVQSALQKFPDSAELRATAGLLDYDAGDHAAARPRLEAAVAAGAVRPRVLHALAQLRYDQLHRNRPADVLLEPGEAGPVLHLLRTALEQSPPLPEVYALFGKLWMESAGRPPRTDLNHLLQGVQAFPEQPAVITRAAIVLAAHGHQERALNIIDFGLAHALTGDSRETYQRLRQHLEPVQPTSL